MEAENKIEKLVASLWMMWGAIVQSRADDIYNEKLNSLYNIGKEAMERAGQVGGVVESVWEMPRRKKREPLLPSRLYGVYGGRYGMTRKRFVKLMMAQIGGPSVRGPDTYRVCPQCLGTGRSIL